MRTRLVDAAAWMIGYVITAIYFAVSAPLDALRDMRDEGRRCLTDKHECVNFFLLGLIAGIVVAVWLGVML